MKNTGIILFLGLALTAGCSTQKQHSVTIHHGGTIRHEVAANPHSEVVPGVEVLVRDYADQLKGRNVAILTNPTGVTRELESTIDVVRAIPGVNVVRLFSPEHGLRGQHFAGEKVHETRDPVSGIPVASLYGATRKPSPEMLEGLDLVLYDIQDVGHRTYTFVSTLTLLMEACEEAGVAVWVLDRPEPMGGKIVGGPMLDADLMSFIGIHNVPQVYGMTPGEWATMIKAERTPGVSLEVIPMDGWRRGMNYGDLGWIWVPPSQHIPHWETSYFYAITGTIGELRRVNEGVGTPTPFELIGASWLDGQQFAQRMNERNLPGVIFRPNSYKPYYGTGNGTLLHGVQIHISDYAVVNPPDISLALMSELVNIVPEQNVFKVFLKEDGSATGFLRAIGSRNLAEQLAKNGDPALLALSMQKNLERFMQRRQKYLIYP